MNRHSLLDWMGTLVPTIVTLALTISAIGVFANLGVPVFLAYPLGMMTGVGWMYSVFYLEEQISPRTDPETGVP